MNKNLFKVFWALLLIILGSSFSSAQTLMPLPAHASVYSGSARGLWFTAPTGFTITGLRMPSEAGTGQQFIHVVKVNDPMPIAFGAQSANFNTLAYISNAPNGIIQSVNIQVNAGDLIGILGTTTGNANSYGPSTGGSTTIGGFPVDLNRFGYQGSIEAGAAPVIWGQIDGQIGRVEMYYMIGGAGFNNAGIPDLVAPTNFCASAQDIKVKVRNYGSNVLNTLQVQWSLDGVMQTPVNITTPIDTPGSALGNDLTVTLG
ncbi:MAG TPA: hypothetical protein VLZ83_08550, partial [Edaphocola sp.]|nr:hypothetical protein [Edaphocola sp.]